MNEEQSLCEVYVPDGTEDVKIPIGLNWSYCRLCERGVILCPKCKNNGTCSGGYGKLKSGEDCDLCPILYALDDYYHSQDQVPTKEIFLNHKL